MAVEMQDEVIKQTVKEEEDGTISQAPEVEDVTIRQSQEEEGWTIRRTVEQICRSEAGTIKDGVLEVSDFFFKLKMCRCGLN